MSSSLSLEISLSKKAFPGTAALTHDRRVTLGHLPPIDGVPPRVEIVGSAVLVLQVVGVLPDVHADQRRLAVGDRVVLVGRRDDRQARAVVYEPGPAGAELVDPGVLQLALEVAEAAERRADRVGKGAVALTAAAGRHGLPEQRVVEVPATVVANRGALVLGDLGQVGDDFLDGLVGPVGALESGIDLVYVGLMMLVVMHAHGGLVDVRLEGGVVIGEGRYLVRHLCSLVADSGANSIAARVTRPLAIGPRTWGRYQCESPAPPTLQLSPARGCGGTGRRPGFRCPCSERGVEVRILSAASFALCCTDGRVASALIGV